MGLGRKTRAALKAGKRRRFEKLKLNTDSESGTNTTMRDAKLALADYMSQLNDKIKDLQEAELDDEDMESDISPYILEERLERRIMYCHKIMCALDANCFWTGRSIHKKIKFTTSRFAAVNSEVEVFISKDEIPDYQDIYDLVSKNSGPNESTISKEMEARLVFKECCKTIKSVRALDFEETFGNHLTDKADSDPSAHDIGLAEKLQANQLIADKNTNEAFEKYVVMQETRPEGDSSLTSSTIDSSENRNSDEEWSEESVHDNSVINLVSDSDSESGSVVATDSSDQPSTSFAKTRKDPKMADSSSASSEEEEEEEEEGDESVDKKSGANDDDASSSTSSDTPPNKVSAPSSESRPRRSTAPRGQIIDWPSSGSESSSGTPPPVANTIAIRRKPRADADGSSKRASANNSDDIQSPSKKRAVEIADSSSSN